MNNPAELAFRFVEFNPRRHKRGADAARVEVNYSTGESEWLWMSPKDIRANLREFGECAELRKALAAYKGGTDDATD